jgi:hypothetical protein
MGSPPCPANVTSKTSACLMAVSVLVNVAFSGWARTRGQLAGPEVVEVGRFSHLGRVVAEFGERQVGEHGVLTAGVIATKSVVRQQRNGQVSSTSGKARSRRGGNRKFCRLVAVMKRSSPLACPLERVPPGYFHEDVLLMQAGGATGKTHRKPRRS